MAVSASAVIEVRSTGATTNGGGFVTGATGTDWSQQDAAQYSVTDAVTAGTTTITSATANFGTDVVGNLLYITGGTGAIAAARYEIISRTNSTTIVVDRSTGLTLGTGATLKIGGALSTIALGLALMTVTGHQMYVKATATYSISTGLATSAGISNTVSFNRIIGYTTTRGDNGRVTIQTTAGVTAYTDGQGGFHLENFIIDGNATGTAGIALSNQSAYAFNCKVLGFTGTGISMTGSAAGIEQCEVTTCAAGVISNQVAGLIKHCYIHDNTGPGAEVINYGTLVQGNIFDTNTGASTDGLIMNAAYSAGRCNIIDNVFYNNGRDGIRNTGTYAGACISGNIFVSNTGFGLNTSAMSPVRTNVLIHHNAYYSNTGGARSGNNAGTGDVTLSGDPFTNSASGDFTLNNTASAGAALRAAGFPGTFGAGTGYRDIGPIQHQDAGGASGGLLRHPGMGGGAVG